MALSKDVSMPSESVGKGVLDRQWFQRPINKINKTNIQLISRRMFSCNFSVCFWIIKWVHFSWAQRNLFHLRRRVLEYNVKLESAHCVEFKRSSTSHRFVGDKSCIRLLRRFSIFFQIQVMCIFKTRHHKHHKCVHHLVRVWFISCFRMRLPLFAIK